MELAMQPDSSGFRLRSKGGGMKNRNNILAALVIGLMAVCATVFAAPIIPTIDEFNGSDDPWTATGNATINSGNPVLDFTISAGMGSDGWVYTQDADFLGDYPTAAAAVGGANISFQFTGASGADQLSLYFYSSSDNGTWYYALPVSDGYQSVYIDSSGTGWTTFDGTSFAVAFADVDLIGIYVANADLLSHNYTLDDFQLNPVPEPETVWMMIAVAISLGITFRGRIMEVAGHLKARVARN